jgi:hypothetical protein
MVREYIDETMACIACGSRLYHLFLVHARVRVSKPRAPARAFELSCGCDQDMEAAQAHVGKGQGGRCEQLVQQVHLVLGSCIVYAL